MGRLIDSFIISSGFDRFYTILLETLRILLYTVLAKMTTMEPFTCLSAAQHMLLEDYEIYHNKEHQ
jgi:hypothetical protein